MKLVIFLINSIVIIGLIIFDYKEFYRISQTVTLIDRITYSLDEKGRYRYEIQKHLDFYLAKAVTDIESLNRLRINNFFGKESLPLDEFGIAKSWPKLDQLLEKTLKLEQLKSDYSQLIIKNFDDIKAPANNSQGNPNNQFRIAIQTWLSDTVETLDDIQGFKVDLSHYLSEKVIQELKQASYTNLIIFALIFAFSLISMSFSQRRYLSKIQTVNDQLNQKKDAANQSKRVLISLMEELSFEKNSAIKMTNSLKKSKVSLQIKVDEMALFIVTLSEGLHALTDSITQKIHHVLFVGLTEKQQERLLPIKEDVAEMLDSSNKLLQLSRIFIQHLEKRMLDTKLLVNQTLALDSISKYTEAQIEVQSPLMSIYADEKLFSQCLLNLLDNAIKYSDPKRSLKIDIYTTSDNEETCLIIQDNGIGMEREHQQKLIRVFERIQHGAGTGIGLPIIKKIMDKHQGRIEINSQANIGSEFRLYFPHPSNNFMRQKI